MFEFETIRDVLSFAVSLERISQDYYRQLVKQVADEGVKEFLADMAAQEAMHEQHLRGLIEDGDSVLATKVPPEEIAAYVETLHIPAELDYKKAVKLARDKENASRMLYTILAGLTTDDQLKQMLLQLADQEREHKEFFEKEYQRICIGEN